MYSARKLIRGFVELSSFLAHSEGHIRHLKPNVEGFLKY